MCHPWEELPIWTEADAEDDGETDRDGDEFRDVQREIAPP
jgi:hypothetical protein